MVGRSGTAEDKRATRKHEVEQALEGLHCNDSSSSGVEVRLRFNMDLGSSQIRLHNGLFFFSLGAGTFSLSSFSSFMTWTVLQTGDVLPVAVAVCGTGMSLCVVVKEQPPKQYSVEERPGVPVLSLELLVQELYVCSD